MRLVINRNRAENRGQEWLLLPIMALGSAKHGQHKSQIYGAAERTPY
jgi:hypothetical protein